jgi:outer membrane protein TolC
LGVCGCRGGASFGIAPSHPPAAIVDAAEQFPADLPTLWQTAEATHPELIAAQIDFTAKQREAAEAKHAAQTELACAQQYAAALALLQKRYELMHRVRSGFYQYAASADLIAAYDAAVKRTEEDVRVMRVAVEEGKTQPRSSLISLEATLEQTKTARAKAVLERSAVWRQLAVEVGLSPDVEAATAAVLPADPPAWTPDDVRQRVLGENVRLQQAIQAEAVARLTWRQLSRSPLRKLQTAKLIEAEAAVGKAGALIAQTVRMLMQETEAALAKYESARRDWFTLRDVIVPQRREQLRLVERQYEIGAIGGTLPELLAARQALSEAELQLAQARIQLWQAAAEVEALLQIEISDSPEELAPAPADGTMP